MGYKTTDDIRDSITDLAVMNMDGKYSTTEYSEVLKAKEQKVTEMLTDFMAAVREYRVNLKAGKEKAKVVRDILNKLTDDDTGKKMGDLLNSETLQDKVGIKESIKAQNPDKLPDLLTIFMQGKADLNAYEGKQWNALYSSQNTQAGKPIVVPDDGAPFIVKKNDAENSAGYKAVRNFDEIYAANLNANVKEADAPSVYLFYSYPGESANTTELKDGDKPKEETQDATAPTDGQSAAAEKKQYIASVYLSCEGNGTIAKSKLTQQGYKVIDVNLTPELRVKNRSYSYLGYTVTTNEKAAVTDIRMAKIKSTSQAVAYGTVKYTAAGFDGHDNSICYTKDTSVGSPILADDIQIADRLSDGKKGYVPVCYFGSAASVCLCRRKPRKASDDRQAQIYALRQPQSQLRNRYAL